MKKIYYGNIQRQITSLIPLIELYITLLTEIELTKNKLNILPAELKSLKKQANFLSLKSDQKSADDLQPELQQAEFNLDSLVDDLDEILINLVTFECKLKNVIALKERLEALQEERINGLTPERIYKLLEKQKQRSETMPLGLSPENNSTLTKKDNNFSRQKLINFGNKLRDRKIAVSLAIVVSISLGWIAGYSSATNDHFNDNKTVEAIQ
jgi:hypothetical protein